MGAQASTPQPGTKLQVIGAGLSRTGTASFSEALQILLKGPVYHAGTQITLGPEVEIRSCITLMSHFPPQTQHSRKITNDIITSRLNGYAAVTDLPYAGFVEQMLELYPDAMVVCTVRDPEAWVKSMTALRSRVLGPFTRFVLLPIPGMRYFPKFIDGITQLWQSMFGEEEDLIKCYYAHIEHLKRVVPKDRLVFFDVRDGWEPLCKALGKDVPVGVPFPRINDGEAIARLGDQTIRKGLKRWAMIFCALGLALPVVFWWWHRLPLSRTLQNMASLFSGIDIVK
jgi:hypothetical protein